MMHVVFTEPKDYLYSATGYFDFVVQDEWMNDTRVQQMIKDIDKTDLLNPRGAYSPVLGSISIRDLSGGVKGLILILKCEDYRTFSSCIFGDNCAEWICKLSLEVDFTFYMEHGFFFASSGDLSRKPVLDRPVFATLPNGLVAHTSGELSHYVNR